MPYRLPALAHIDWSPVVRAFAAAPSFALVTHVRADTDGIGSELALHRYLRSLGKDVRILNVEANAARLALLDPDRAVARVPRRRRRLRRAARRSWSST